jgi:arginyl-tRNA synthetase
MKLARQAGSVAAQLRVQGEEKHTARSRLLLLSTARIVLAETMAVLGIQPLDRM